MAMVRGQYAQLMAPGLHDVWEQWLKLKQPQEEYSQVFNVSDSKKAFEDEVEFAGFGPTALKSEGAAVLYDQIIQGGTVRYNMLTYALAARISHELYDDDQYKLTHRCPEGLARSAHFTREQVTWNVINNGFSAQTTSDGVSLFNANHPLLGGTTTTSILPLPSTAFSTAGNYPNRPSTAVDFSRTALQDALVQYNRMIDGQGLPVTLRPAFVLCAAENQWLVSEVLGSALQPGTANNDINSVLKYALKMFVGTYLTDADAWFLLAPKDQHNLKFFRRQALDVDYADDFDTRSLKVMAFERFAAGALTWPGTWGSPGA